MTWADLNPDQRRSRVRELIHAGATYAETAQALRTTRTAVAGVVYRARSQGERIRRPIEREDPPPMKPTGSRSKGGKTAVLQEKMRRARKAHAGLTTFVPLDVPTDPTPLRASAWQPLPGTTPVPLADRTGCAWPTDSPDGRTLFCNAPTDDKHSWCARHFALGNRPVVVGTPKRVAPKPKPKRPSYVHPDQT